MEILTKYAFPIVISVIGFFLVNTYSDYKTLIKAQQEIITQQAVLNSKIETLSDLLNKKVAIETEIRTRQDQLRIKVSNLEIRVDKLEAK